MTPSDISFPLILDKVPVWQKLVIRLGVPIDQVETLQADSIMGGFRAIAIWRDQHTSIARECPPTWEFLLKAVEDCAGSRVRNELATKVIVDAKWSIEQVWLISH